MIDRWSWWGNEDVDWWEVRDERPLRPVSEGGCQELLEEETLAKARPAFRKARRVVVPDGRRARRVVKSRFRRAERKS